MTAQSNISTPLETTAPMPVGWPSYESEVSYCDEIFKGLIRSLKKQKDYLVDTQMLETAYDIAKSLHANTRRHSGVLYLRHPLAVFKTLANLKCETNVLAAGLLHDTLEDCPYTYDEIRQTFNPEIADIVEAVTAIKRVEKAAEEKFETLSKEEKHRILDELTDQKLVNAKYQRESFLVRFADREHNLKTLDACTLESRRKKVESTQSFLIPAAKLFGMRYFVTTLNDYCMKYVDYSPDPGSLISDVHRKRNDLQAVSKNAYSAFDQLLEEAVSAQNFFSFPLYNPLARQDGGKTGDNLLIEPRRRMRPYEIAMQAAPDLPLDQAKRVNIERSEVCLSEVLLVCGSEKLSEIRSRFIGFHRSFLEPHDITFMFEPEDPAGDCVKLVLTDLLENNYHVVLVPAEKLSSYFIGLETARIPRGSVKDVMRPKITVFAYSDYKGLRELQVPEGATALDLAFALQPKLALSATAARVKKYAPNISFGEDDGLFTLGTILNENDVVNFKADYEQKIGSKRFNAKLDWFSFITTEHARKQLIQYFQSEYHME